MSRTTALTICLTWLLTLTGCAGSGEVIPLQLKPPSADSGKMAKQAQGLRVDLGSFEDARPFKTGLGTRSHLWGGTSYFDLPGGNPGDSVAKALADYLTAKGWTIVKRGSGEASDVVLIGKILELSVHAKSRVGSTELTAKSKFAILATNAADGSTVRMTLNGSGAEDVFWFDKEDLEAVLNEVLTDSFHKLIQDTKVENKMLRLKSP